MSAKVKWYAVLYPSERLHTINDCLRRVECKTAQEANALCQQWKEERPHCRAVVRRETEVYSEEGE